MKALAALDNAATAAARTALGAPGFDAAPFEYFFHAVSSLPEDCREGFIVLDDFHLIENESILRTLPLLIRKLSPVYKLAILSRSNPPGFFSDLALKDRIGDVTDRDLRFTRKQIIGLYKGYGIELSANDVLEVESKTGGWALGLVARLFSVRTDGQNRVGQASGMNNRQICEKTGLKLNTVKAHLYKLYEKLEVNSGVEAVLKARRINLIPKSE